MKNTPGKETIQFLLSWVITNGIVILIGLVTSFILAFLVFFGPMGYDSYEDTGTVFQQTLIMMICCVLTGIGLGYFQRRLLSRFFKVSKWWLFSIALGLIITELITGFICYRSGLVGRMELDYLTNVLVFSAYGLIIGTIQFFMLRAYFKHSIIWVLSNTLALGMGMLVAGSVYDNPLMILTYITGMIIYGSINGATFVWLLQSKEPDHKL